LRWFAFRWPAYESIKTSATEAALVDGNACSSSGPELPGKPQTGAVILA